jgi:uncharacterized protein YukE
VLDLHRVRQAASDARRHTQQVKYTLGQINNSFTNLGSGFTSDQKFMREYTNVKQAIRDVERDLDRLLRAVDDLDRKAR